LTTIGQADEQMMPRIYGAGCLKASFVSHYNFPEGSANIG